MRLWLNAAFQSAVVILSGAAAVALVWWLGRCRHPNPHYVRPQRSDEPGRYCCYECGRSWQVETRDPAWHPTRLVQKFSGFDQTKAAAARSRAAAEASRHQRIALQRGDPARPASQLRRRPSRHAEVVDLNSRKPA
jgi:hypothetical protein